MTKDVRHGIEAAGVTAPEAGTWIGWQRTVQGPATPAHKSGHNFMLTKHDAISKYILIF